MGVRVRVEIEYGDRRIETIALVNTGYEGDVPEILVPLGIAERLGLWPRLPDNTIIEVYRTAGGLVRVYRVSSGRVRLVTEEGAGDPKEVHIAISEYADEVLLNDQLISAMGIVVEDPAKGLWRLHNEDKIRKSVC